MKGDELKAYIEERQELRAQFLDFLTDPQRVGSEADWGRKHDVPSERLRKWKLDPKFKAELEDRLLKLNIDNVRTQSVLDAMWAKAQQGDVQAAKTYFSYVEKLMPPRKWANDDTEVQDLTDLELAEQLEEAAAELRANVK